MVKRAFDWENGAELKQHTEHKLKVLQEHFGQYLCVRCPGIPQQTRFRLAIVDGFAGAGRYKDGEPGSPVVFVETLNRLSNEINMARAANGMAPLTFECHLILNDADWCVTEMLKETLAPVLAAAREQAPNLNIEVKYPNKKFECAYPDIRQFLRNRKFGNVLFNLDQCGDTTVHMDTLKDILRSFSPSGEVFLTFAIEPLLAFLQKSNPQALQKRLCHLGINATNLAPLDSMLSTKEWLGTAENIVFDAFQNCARFVSPFAINNPEGWRYWLMHFSNVPRARQVYNDILHDNASHQTHFGRSGLKMFAFDPDEDRELYLFEQSDRKSTANELAEDIPKLVEQSGDTMSINQFYERAYNFTPAHSKDIKNAMFGNPDLEVLTRKGKARRKAHTIKDGDTLRSKRQKSFHIF